MYNLRKNALDYFLLSRENLFDKEATGKKINDLTTEGKYFSDENFLRNRVNRNTNYVLTYFILMFTLSWKLTVLAAFSFIFSMHTLKPLWTKAGETER